MKGEHNWNSEKKDLRELTVEELEDKLQELRKEKVKLESDMMRNNGTSMKVRNYPSEKHTRPYGNIKKIKKTIAFVNTILTENIGFHKVG